MGTTSALLGLRLEVAAPLVHDTAAFYLGTLELHGAHQGDAVALDVGETALELRAAAGAPFYHFALLVPGDRFDAALDWSGERVELLEDRETRDVVFDFTFWNARAVYFHDPAGSIVELIAHRGVGETGTTGAFAADELLGVSEVGIACDPPPVADVLERELGLEVWDGTVDGEARLAFVGEKARTLILCRPGRPWLPTGRPAEAHPVEVVLSGEPVGEVRLEGGSCVRRRALAGDRSVRASPSSRNDARGG